MSTHSPCPGSGGNVLRAVRPIDVIAKYWGWAKDDDCDGRELICVPEGHPSHTYPIVSDNPDDDGRRPYGLLVGTLDSFSRRSAMHVTPNPHMRDLKALFDSMPSIDRLDHERRTRLKLAMRSKSSAHESYRAWHVTYMN